MEVVWDSRFADRVTGIYPNWRYLGRCDQWRQQGLGLSLYAFFCFYYQLLSA